MRQSKLFGGVLALASPAIAAFNVYALHDREALRASLGVSPECLSALNYTVQCDGPNAVRATKNSESDLTWSMENLTTLCTDGCSKSLTTWLEVVEQNCDGEELVVNGLIVDPKAFPLKYISGFDLACLQDSWDKKPVACGGENPPADCDKKDPEGDADTLIVTNAYNKELYCSECFMLLWRQRIESPVFPQGNLMDHFTEQFNRLQAACSTKLPQATPDPTVVLRAKASTTLDSGYGVGASTVFRYTQPPAVTVTEEAIARRGSAPRALQTFYTTAIPDRTTQLGAIEACGKYYNVVPGDTCNAISAEFEVTMDELLEYNPKCNDQGRCEPCEPEATTPPSPRTEPDEKPSNKEPFEEKSSDEPPKDMEDDDRDKGKPTHTKDENPLPTGGGNSTMISKDGSCNDHIICVGSPFGNCCSTSGWCGFGPAWCGVGNCVSGDCDTEDKTSGKPAIEPPKPT
ncbi:hypothetical protein McanMca71_000758 [Microsporum canis]